MSTLASMVLKDVIANLPTAGIAGRVFYATDTHVIMRDNGTTWDNVTTGDTFGSAFINAIVFG